MPNPFHGNVPKDDRGKTSPAPPAQPKGHRPDATPERTAAWPGLPGKSQGGTRDKSGTRKLRQGPREEGI